MSAVFTVFKKEFVENLRARRTLLSALLFGPLLGPAMLAVILNVTSGRAEERAEEKLELPVVGAEHAPNLVEYLKRQGVEIESAPDDAEAVVRDETEEVVLSIPEAFGEAFTSGEPATVTLIRDRSQRESGTKVRRVERLLEAYSGQIGALRLQARGVSPAVDARGRGGRKRSFNG